MDFYVEHRISFLPFLLLLNPKPVFFISVMTWASAGLSLFWDAKSLIVFVLMVSFREFFLPVEDSFLEVGISLSVRQLTFFFP